MKKILNKRGFTLIELMIVVAILGILAAVAIPAFINYMKRAKTSEATINIDRIYEGVIAYYQQKHVGNTVSDTSSTRCLPADVDWTPATDPTESEYIATPADWATDTWQALDFAMGDNHLYQYKFTNSVEAGGCQDEIPAQTTFKAEAAGDLNGDGKKSNFSRIGEVTSTGELHGSSGIYKVDPLE